MKRLKEHNHAFMGLPRGMLGYVIIDVGGEFMKDSDSHFWVSDVVKRLPIELIPKVPSWSSLLTAITQLKTERNNAIAELERLKDAIKEMIEDNLYLADGENCTLIKLKRSISYDE